MGKELYPYVSGNLLEKPNTYMYTPYHGKEFLHQYQAERTSLLEYFKSFAPRWSEEDLQVGKSLLAVAEKLEMPCSCLEVFSTQAKFSFSQREDLSSLLQQRWDREKIDLEDLLQVLLKIFVMDLHKELLLVEEILETLRRRFEAKRLLFREYERGLKKGRSPQASPAPYAALACLFSLQLGEGKCLKTINVVLKLNDFLSAYRSEFHGAQAQSLALISVSRELAYVSHLCDQEGVS